MDAEHASLVEQLVAERVEPELAIQLVHEAPEVCRRQLLYLDYQDDPGDRAAILIAAIEGDWPEPARYYWERVSQQQPEDKSPSPAPTEDAPAPSQAVDTAVETSAPAPASAPTDAAVERLLGALETIAGMRHAHRNNSDAPCPVCVAWDALKAWEHNEAMQ